MSIGHRMTRYGIEVANFNAIFSGTSTIGEGEIKLLIPSEHILDSTSGKQPRCHAFEIQSFCQT